MKCPICNIENDIERDSIDDSLFYRCYNCFLILSDYEKPGFKVAGGHIYRVIEKIYADLVVLKSEEDVFNYIEKRGFNFTNDKLTAAFSSNMKTRIRDIISRVFDNLEEKEIICAAAFVNFYQNSEDDYGKLALLAFTNNRIICSYESNIIFFDYLKSKFRVCSEGKDCHFQLDDCIFVRSESIYNYNGKKDAKEIFYNYSFDKIIRYIIDGKRKIREQEKKKEEKQKQLNIKQTLDSRITAEMKKYLRQKILSDYELTNEEIIFKKLKEKFDISYNDFEEKIVEEHFINYIKKLLEDLSKTKYRIKDETVMLLKKYNDEIEVSKTLIEKYDITLEATNYYINKAKNVIKNENDKKESENKKSLIKEVLVENNYDAEKTMEIVKEKYQLNEAKIKKCIYELKDELMDNIDDICENVLIENEGNIFKSIKDLMTKYNVSQEDAKYHVNKVYKEINGESNKKQEVNNQSYSSYTKPSEVEEKKSFSELFYKPYEGPKCPHCGSGDIGKISSVKRVASVGLFGIASSTIGKSMECHRCGYKW